MANISGSYDPNAEASSSFDPVPAGEYRAKLIEGEIEDISKREDKGRCLKLTWQIETGPFDGRLVWQRLNMWGKNMTKLDQVISIANSQFAAIRQATGRLAPQDTDELLHIPCQIKIAVRSDPSGQYGPQNEVKAVKAIGGGSAPASVSGPAVNHAQATSGGGGLPWKTPA